MIKLIRWDYGITDKPKECAFCKQAFGHGEEHFMVEIQGEKETVISCDTCLLEIGAIFVESNVYETILKHMATIGMDLDRKLMEMEAELNG